MISLKHSSVPPLSSDATLFAFLVAFPFKGCLSQTDSLSNHSCQNRCHLFGAVARGIRQVGVEEAEESAREGTSNHLNKLQCSTLLVCEDVPEGRGSGPVLQMHACSLEAATWIFRLHVHLQEQSFQLPAWRLPPSPPLSSDSHFWVTAPQVRVYTVLYLN